MTSDLKFMSIVERVKRIVKWNEVTIIKHRQGVSAK